MKLSPDMTLEQFDHGYWFATQLAAFAKSLGLPGGRKDQLERAIRAFLSSGEKVKAPFRPPKGAKDRLGLDVPVRVYKNEKATKDFLEREALRLEPRYRRRSGARYRLNRWREAQLQAGRRITYRDLVREYVRLSMADEPFEKIPHGRYINFLAEFLKREEGATHPRARAAWHRLKSLDCPKTYAGWRRATSGS
jgi:hypothetical protein